jgi:hypothetical protein
MTFLIRQISRTAEGRQIVRPSRVERDRIVIGRAAECDIHLSDLAVDMRHATAHLNADGSVTVTATGTLGFAWDGRTVTTATIDPAGGGELRFGNHRLSIGQDADAVTIDVERVEGGEARDQARLFSLRGLLPGKRISAWSFVLLVLAAFLAWPIYSFATWRAVEERPDGVHGDESWSSGKLSLAHASLENDCQACHQQPFVAVRDESCKTCHADAHDHAAPARLASAKATPGIGGQLSQAIAGGFNIPPGRCVECHTEHEGATRMPATAQVFCTDCHASMDTRLTDTKILNAGDFGTDHPQFRPALVIDPAGTARRRVSLDKRPTHDNGLKFPHALHLSKTGGVARMAQTMMAEQGFGAALACKDCHVADPDGVGFRPVDMEQDCAACHSLAFERIGGTVRTLRHGEPAQVIADLRAYYRSTGPDRPINLGGMARRRPGDVPAMRTAADYAAGMNWRARNADSAIRAVFSRGGACYDCHTVIAPADGSTDFRIRPVVQQHRFMEKGWFSHAAHRTESCASCHKADTSKLAGDLLLPGIETCRDCHGGENARADVPSSCAMCHDYHAGDDAPWATRQRTSKNKISFR